MNNLKVIYKTLVNNEHSINVSRYYYYRSYLPIYRIGCIILDLA